MQPEPYGRGISIDGLTAKSIANLGGRPFARPPVGRFSAEEIAEERTSPNAIEASTPRILASRKMMHWLRGRQEEGLSRAGHPRCGNYWRRHARLAQQTPKMMVAVD